MMMRLFKGYDSGPPLSLGPFKQNDGSTSVQQNSEIRQDVFQIIMPLLMSCDTSKLFTVLQPQFLICKVVQQLLLLEI